MKRKGSTTSIVIATVAGLAVLGVAGYNMITGNCSSCVITGTPTSTTTVAATTDCDGCCPLKDATDGQATLVATTGDSCALSTACDAGTKAACDSAAKTACETACSGAEVQTVATEAKECGTACAGDACGVDADACCGKCEKGQELAKAPQ